MIPKIKTRSVASQKSTPQGSVHPRNKGINPSSTVHKKQPITSTKPVRATYRRDAGSVLPQTKMRPIRAKAKRY